MIKGLRIKLLGALLSIFAASGLASSGLTGQSAPDFVLKNAAGENLRLSEYRGDVVIFYVTPARDFSIFGAWLRAIA